LARGVRRDNVLQAVFEDASLPAGTLIVHGTVVTMDAGRNIVVDGAVAVSGCRIAGVGKSAALRAQFPHFDEVDATGKLVIPGLVDAHNHPAHFLSKGLFDDIEIRERWATRLYPFDTRIGADQSYWGSLGTFAEMIRSGTTCFADPGGFHPDATLAAAKTIGIRGVVARSTGDISDPVRPMPDGLLVTPESAVAVSEELHARWHGAENGRLRVWFGLRSATAVSDALCRTVKAAAERRGVGIHVHLATTPAENQQVMSKWGMRSVARYERLGLLDANLYAVHMGAIDDDEVELIARRRVKVGHCPSASMLGAFGCIAHGKFPELIAAGATVAIGTDAAAISRFLDMVREMYLAACAHKDARADARVMGAHTAMEMATINGAKALLWDDAIGSLEAGQVRRPRR
jgi:cytosine/adenosine deaminase-related metal-dependent hydrolase